MSAFGILGVYYSIKAARLFLKDIMARVFWLLAVGLSLVVLTSAADFSLRFADISPDIPLVRMGVVIATGLVTAGIIMLVRWANSSPEPRT